MSASTAVPVSVIPTVDTTFEQSVTKLYEDLARMEDHDSYDVADLEDIGEALNLEAVVEKSIAESDLVLLNDTQNSSRPISELEFTEINDSFRGSVTDEDLVPDVPFGPLSEMERLEDAATAITASIARTQYAPATVDLFRFAERRYFSFLRTMNSKYRDFHIYQPTPYPMKKLTLMMYLYWLRVDKDYKFSTIQSTFCYGFLSFAFKTKRDRDIRGELGLEIKNTLKALLRKFGNDKFKVEPLMNPDLVKLRLMCDQHIESEARLDALLAQGRARGLRSDSFQYVKLKHLTWTKTVADNKIRLSVNMKIKKDKVLLGDLWRQNLFGWVNLSMCPNIALLIYLADCRKVFKKGSAANCLIAGKFDLIVDADKEPLFTPSGKISSWQNRDMSNAMKNLSKTIGKQYSTRSMRSGLVVTCLLRNRIENNGVVDDRVSESLADFVHWKNKESLKPYDRWITQYFSSINAIQEPSERVENLRTINQRAIDMGFLEEDSEIATVDENAQITDAAVLTSLIYHDYTGKKTRRWKPHVRRLQPPKFFKDYWRGIDKGLDRAMKEEKGSKDSVWLAFWKQKSENEAATDKQCQKFLVSDLQYKGEKNRDRRRAIERAYGASSIIRKWLVDPKAQVFVKKETEKRLRGKGKSNKSNVLSKSTYKRKLGALMKKEEAELEKVKNKFQKLKDELEKEYNSAIVGEDLEEEYFEMDDIILSDSETE